LTQAAVRDFQTKHGLTVDGIVGPQTWSALWATSGTVETKATNVVQASINPSPPPGSSPPPHPCLTPRATDGNAFKSTDVMLRYVIEKVGGSASWNNTTGNVTVRHNGNSIVYTKNDFHIINGRVVINRDRLASDLGIDSRLLHHRPGDPFLSLNDAALAFALAYQDKSLNTYARIDVFGPLVQGMEIGAWLYDVERLRPGTILTTPQSPVTDRYSTFYSVVEGGHNHVIPGSVFGFFDSPSGPGIINSTRAGHIHTHPICYGHGNVRFSPQDIWFGDRLGLPMYLVTLDHLKFYLDGVETIIR
jgi:hypothetical protein